LLQKRRGIVQIREDASEMGGEVLTSEVVEKKFVHLEKGSGR